MAFLSGARWRSGYHAFGGEASYRGDLMTHRVSFNPYLHTSQTFQILVDVLRRPSGALPTFPDQPPEIPVCPPFQPSRQELDEVRAVVDGLSGGRAGSPLVLLNANASDLIPLRRWPPERYVALAHRLLDAYPDLLIGLTGAPNEAEAAEAIAQKIGSPRCISMAGKTTLRQLLVLCQMSDVLVTNDSGPAHFATLTPVDVVVLFGPETPKLFASTSPRTHALWAGIVCSPCINAFNDRASPCRDNQCMQLLTVDRVFQEVRLHLDRRLSAVARGREGALR
jgi:ADP-heptose:LPS heptosyltransferase